MSKKNKLTICCRSYHTGTHTGGIDASLLTTAVYPEGVDESTVTSGENMITKLMIQGKVTTEKIDELFSIFHLVLTDAKLDAKTKVIEMLREKKSNLESRIQGAGHSFANSRMKSRYRVGGYIDEILGGISSLDTVKSLLKEAEEDWPTLLARLEKIRTTILESSTCRDGMILDITGDEAVLTTIQPSIESFLEKLPGDPNGTKLCNFYKETHPWVPEAKKRMQEHAPIQDEGFIVPTQVSYVGKAGLMYDEGERIPGSAAVVSRFLRTGYLWDRVRVMGGAYGGFCTFSSFSGLLSFLSYRDPNLDKTLDVYDLAADDLMAAADALENDPDALTTAIIGAIGDLDGALSPDQKGYKAFTQWIMNQSPEYRQQYRDEILNTKPSDFRDFAERLRSLKNPSVAVVSSKGAFEIASKAGKVMTLKEIL
jgi:presequence protease